MDKLYTIGFYKLFDDVGAKNWHKCRVRNVDVCGEMMDVFFCKNEKGIFAIATKSTRSGAHFSCGHWHSGEPKYDVYFRKDFASREEGNEFYLNLRRTMTIQKAD